MNIGVEYYSMKIRNLLDCDGQQHFRQHKDEKLLFMCLYREVRGVVKIRGDTILVGRMFSSTGVGPLIQLHGKLNAAACKKIIKQHVIPSRASLVLNAYLHEKKKCPFSSCKNKFFKAKILQLQYSMSKVLILIQVKILNSLKDNFRERK